MRILTAILMLAAAIPSYAQMATLRVIDQNHAGNGDLVKEYEGRQRGGLEADVAYSKVSGSTYLGIDLNGLNGPNENGYIDLNLGADLSIKGKFSNLTHRTPFLMTFTSINGQYVTPTRNYSFNNGENIKISTESTTKLTDLTSGPIAFDRQENEAKLAYNLPNYPDQQLTLGIWQESENGSQLARYPNATSQVMRDNLNRQTRDLYLGLNTPMGNGDIAFEYTQRVFEDESSTVPARTSKLIRPEASKQLMNLYDVRFRSGTDALIPFAGALSARTRTNKHNDYTSSAYSATLGASYKPAKKVYLTAKAYGRVVGVYENQAYVNDLGIAYGSTSVAGVPLGPHPEIDRSNLIGEVKGRYEFSDKLSFKAAYKYENNYRRNAELFTESFGTATYNTGFYSDGTQTNAVAAQDTKQTMSAGLEASLPFDAELGVDYAKMTANHAAFESAPTDQDIVAASVIVPLPFKLTLLASGEYVAEENKKSNLTNTSMHQNSYQTALEWAGTSKVSAGVDYSYDQTSYRGEGFWGTSHNPTGNVQLVNLIHVPGMLYRYENNVIGLHATVYMPKGFTLTGRGTYTMSRGSIPVYLTGIWRDFSANPIVTNLGPSDTRITSGSLALKYVQSKDLTARLGYRRDQWVDKVDKTNSGWVNTIDASVSAKF